MVHDTNLYTDLNLKNIELIQFPKIRSSYFVRIMYELFIFNSFCKKNNIQYWLSMLDISTRLNKKVKQSVYCHNASPFKKTELNDLVLEPRFFLFTLFYRLLYRFNIKSNEYVIVQQLWIKKQFEKMFSLNPNKILISRPEINTGMNSLFSRTTIDKNNKYKFFYPTFPRPFKNINVICESVKLLNSLTDSLNYEVIITIDGSENIYAKKIIKKYSHLRNISFVGQKSRNDVYNYYKEIQCLIFPSKLETWGLPISEFKPFGGLILAANLEYSKETVNGYEKIVYFDPDNPKELANIMMQAILNTSNFTKSYPINYPQPLANNWGELYDILLNSK